jgi:magnesium chelatase family protein
MKIAAPLTTATEPALQWIEVAIFFQIPNFHIIGLPGPEISEARERVRAAILSSGFEFPKRKIIVNLSPASVKKQGTGIDLAIALGILAKASKKKISQHKIVAWGELGLDGTIKPAGQISRVLYSAWKHQTEMLLVSEDEYEEAHEKLQWMIQNVVFNSPPPKIVGSRWLSSLWNQIERNAFITKLPVQKSSQTESEQMSAHLLPLNPAIERLILASAAGNLHVLLLGPKGSGKTSALEWLSHLLPSPSANLKTEQMLIQNKQTFTQSIVRRVSPQIKPAALIGSVSRSGKVIAGECTLAHGGILIADEFPEWPRDSKEALREPLERGLVTINRIDGQFELPARFILAITGNQCPCGGSPNICNCTIRAKLQYQKKLSGPILDRLDLISVTKAVKREEPVCLQELKTIVHKAREKLIETWGNPPGLLDSQVLENIIQSDSTIAGFLGQLTLESLRARHKILRIALTLAAIDGKTTPEEIHFLEAASFHPERLCA